MSTHTPGPWQHPKNHYGVYGGPDQTLITTVFSANKNAQADGDLIAAAPTLLEALKKALDHIQSHIESDVLYGRIANFEDHELADTHRMLWLTLDTMGETK